MKRLFYQLTLLLSLLSTLSLTTACGGDDDGPTIIIYEIQNITINDAHAVFAGTWRATEGTTVYTFICEPNGAVVMKKANGQVLHSGNIVKEGNRMFFSMGTLKAEVLTLSSASFSLYYTESGKTHTLEATKLSNATAEPSPTIPTGNNVNANNTTLDSRYGRLEFPHLKGGTNNIVLIHTERSLGTDNVNYSVEWDTDLKPEGWNWANDGGSLRSQRWSAYTMHNGNSSTLTNRKPHEEGGDFTEYPNDPLLSTQYQFTADPYWRSGYDHGHIFPSADRAWGYKPAANIQTFYMTNMQPQENGFNAKVWANMEKMVREWGNKGKKVGGLFRDTLYIVKGGTIDHASNIIRTIGSGQNRIPVPKYFWVALLCKNSDPTNGGYTALGFWIEHKASDDNSLGKYVVNIDELEQLTGIDFFCNLPDAIENIVEALPKENVRRAWGL